MKMTTDSRTSAIGQQPGHGPIMIELDNSYESAEALRWAASISRTLGAPLSVTSTWRPGIGEFRSEAHDAVVRRRMTELRDWSSLASDVAVTPTLHIVEGAWPADFVRESTRQQAVLLAVPLASSSSRSRSASEAAAESLLHTATASVVAVVPAGGANRTIRRIVVGAPDGASPQHLVDVAVLLAQACAAQVHVVSVLPTGPEWVPTTNPNSMWQIERRRRLDRWMPVLEARELRHEFHVVESTDPFDAWARIARDVHADLIIASADKRSNPVSRRHASVVRLARTTGLVVVSVPGGTEVHDG